MIYLKNCIDGFKLIIGGFVQNVILMLVMIICVRSPTYEYEERTEEAMIVYIFLIFYHLLLAIIRYWNLF